MRKKKKLPVERSKNGTLYYKAYCNDDTCIDRCLHLIIWNTGINTRDPADVALGQDASSEDKEAWRDEHGLNDPIVVQYGKYMYNVVCKGDFGTSYKNGKSITHDRCRDGRSPLKQLF